MTRVQWGCRNCETPNILIYDETQDGQHSCSCNKCGAPAVFDTIAQEVLMVKRGTFTVLDTCSTHVYATNMSIDINPWRV